MDLIKKIGFKPKSFAIALDPAHGKVVSGNRSPDGKHIEYIWSRNIISEILELTQDLKSNKWDSIYPFKGHINEPGLKYRVNIYNEIKEDYDLLLVLSLHNDAYKKPAKWWNGPGGFTLFTSRGETIADPLCSFIGKEMQSYLPDEKFRFDYGLSSLEKNRDLDREADFTIISGYRRNHKKVEVKYAGLLIENLFMDIPTDYNKLMNPKWNKNLAEVYSMTFMSLATELGFDNFIKNK